MGKAINRNIWLAMLVFCRIMLCATPAKIEANVSDSTYITAAGPRPGPVAVTEVILPTRQAIEQLNREGYDISNIQGCVATIYATPDELTQLRKAGYDYRIMEWQPKPPGPGAKGLGVYHDYASLTSDLQDYASAHPDICRLFTIGQSVQRRELWAMLITDNPYEEEDEPEFKYIATMHGDEPLGTELCLYFIDLLLNSYGVDPRITSLIDSTVIWIVPLMNPDGLELGSRFNVQGYDLNRSFPAYPYDFTGTIFDGEPLGDAGKPPEAAHVMRWTARNSFVLSANFHCGTVVVNYPYDDDGRGNVDSPTPDDLLFEEVSRRYSRHNPPMWNSPRFPDGITNGAAWLVIVGGMQDWNYRYASCSEVTIELSDIKRPPASQIPAFWSNNRESMLSYLEAIHMGVRGIITDRASAEPLWAQVWVEGNAHPVFTDPDVGDYHRMLLPGTYNLTFEADGYLPHSVNNVTVTDGPATRVDVELTAVQADLNADGSVDLKDFSKLARYWLLPESSVDIAPLPDGDGIVDFQDLAFLSNYWLTH